MSPGFHSTRHALFFGAVLALFLVLPVALHSVGGVSLEQSYRGISERAGNFNRIRHEIFDDRSPIDILFCGSSLLNNAMEPGYVERELSRSLGRPAKVVLLRQSWQGPDMNYFVARDLLEHRPVKLLVIAAPAWIHRSSQPHVQLFRVIRYGDHPGALDGLPLRSKLALYADFVLGAPRQAVSLLRPNLIDPQAGMQPEPRVKIGYAGGPFIPHAIADPQISPEDAIYSERNRDRFRFDGPPLNGYQEHFLRKTVELAREHGTLLTILHMPSPSERGAAAVLDRPQVAGLLGDNVYFVGVPLARLYRGIPDSEFLDFYQDEHVNPNGMELYTKAVTPSLIRLYEHATRIR